MEVDTMLMRTDPFRELDRIAQQAFGANGTLARPAVMPMDAWRDGDTFQVEFDLPAAAFDAIVAAEWPEPPAIRPVRGALDGHPGSGPGRRAAEAARGPVSRPRHPGIGEWARQRSPPL